MPAKKPIKFATLTVEERDGLLAERLFGVKVVEGTKGGKYWLYPVENRPGTFTRQQKPHRLHNPNGMCAILEAMRRRGFECFIKIAPTGHHVVAFEKPGGKILPKVRCSNKVSIYNTVTVTALAELQNEER